jgi:23S rRNA pseudouridine955/2504/2580 synthase
MTQRTVTVEPDDGGVRLDRWLRRRFPDLGNAKVQKLLRTGQIRIDGGRAKANQRLVAGQEVRLPPFLRADAVPRRPPPRQRDVAALKRLILYEDEQVLVLDKPAGLAVQGGSGLSRHLDQMLESLVGAKGERPRLVHRLDKETSGILVLAKTVNAAGALTRSFRTAAARKIYWALVKGVPAPSRGLIEKPLAKQWTPAGERVVVAADGKPARSRYAVVDTLGKDLAWLALAPLTGRTHQLRVHCAALGHPIVGDAKYGGEVALAIGGPAGPLLHLHARAIDIPHPSGKRLRVVAPLPPALRASWRTFGFDPREGDDPFAPIRFKDRTARA